VTLWLGRVQRQFSVTLVTMLTTAIVCPGHPRCKSCLGRAQSRKVLCLLFPSNVLLGFNFVHTVLMLLYVLYMSIAVFKSHQVFRLFFPWFPFTGMVKMIQNSHAFYEEVVSHTDSSRCTCKYIEVLFCMPFDFHRRVLRFGGKSQISTHA